MKLIQKLFDFYLDASIHVAIAVYCLIRVTEFFLNIPADTHLSLYVFFGTIACYNFIKYGVEAEKYILVANRYHKNIQIFSFACLGIGLYHASFLNFQTWIAIGVLVVLTGLYALPILPTGIKLRSHGLLKIALVGLIWTGTTVVLPILALNETISWDILIEAIQRFVLVLILILPFEIRDLDYDSADLNTFPQRYGVANTKAFGYLASLLFFGLTFIKDDIGYREIIGCGVLFLLLVLLLYTTKRNQSRYFASFWVEAIPVFWWGVVWSLYSYF